MVDLGGASQESRIEDDEVFRAEVIVGRSDGAVAQKRRGSLTKKWAHFASSDRWLSID